MEHLVIRFGVSADAPVAWLVWSEAEQEIIATGELSSPVELSSLKERTKHQSAIALIPGCDVSLRTVELPAKAGRKALTAIPYMLEDEVVGDIENQFIVLGPKKDNSQNVLLIDHDRMGIWLGLLEQAGIHCSKMLPDFLALPVLEDKWHACQMGNELLIRQSDWQASMGETSWIYTALEAETKSQEQPVSIEFITEPEIGSVANAEINFNASALPLQVLATNAIASKFTLLQDQYKQKKKGTGPVKQWRIAAILATVAVLTTFVDKGLNAYSLQKQNEELQQQIVAEYKRAFPEARRIVNVRSQMRQKLAQFEEGGSGVSMLVMMSQLSNAFSTSNIKPQSIRFDRNRSELRIQAEANNFEALEAFKRAAEQQGFSVEQGAINNRDNKVVGSLAIRS